MNLSLSNVSFTYPSGVVALRGVDLTIDAGEAVALIGENGAGKTTLAKHLNGLLKPDTGQVLVGRWDTQDYGVAQLAARVGFAFQNPDDQLFARTVRDEVAFGPRNLKQDQAAVEAHVAAALDQVGLTDAAQAHPYDLPAAQRKLVSLAAILAMQTPAVILDEPTMGQDSRGIARIGQIVAGLKAAERTVLTISHDIDFCADHFARVVVMAGGRIVADGPASIVLAREGLLADAGVEPPQLVRLGLALALPETPLTFDGFLAALRHQRAQSREESG